MTKQEKRKRSSRNLKIIFLIKCLKRSSKIIRPKFVLPFSEGLVPLARLRIVFCFRNADVFIILKTHLPFSFQQCQSKAWIKKDGDANGLCYYTASLNCNY